jgi:hypothetical protein
MPSENPLADTGLSKDVQDLVIDQISSGVQELQLVVKKIGGKGASVAIRDDDFPLLREVATSVASLAGGVLFHAWAPAAIASLVVLLYTFRKNGIDLNPMQGALVRELKRRPGELTADDAALLLDAPPDLVSKELQNLLSIPRHDGVIVSIASVDKDGRWRLIGV